MKIFIDTADPEQIKTYYDTGIIDGVTTNPTLATQVGRPYKEIVGEILAMVDGPVSLEVLGTEYDEIMREAKGLAALNKNVVVKVPMIPAGIKAVKALSAEGIRTNVTLVFSATQALLAAKAGAYFVSPFIGRVSDISYDGTELINEIRLIYDNYKFETQILAASIRSPRDVALVALSGADIVTIPPDVIDKLFKHPLTDIGLKRFLDDFKASGQQPLV